MGQCVEVPLNWRRLGKRTGFQRFRQTKHMSCLGTCSCLLLAVAVTSLGCEEKKEARGRGEASGRCKYWNVSGESRDRRQQHRRTTQ